MPKGDVETYWETDSWKNKVEGEGGVLSAPSSEEEAVKAGREEAKRRLTEHIIRNQDGKIAERNSYGHDPRNVPG